MPVLFPFGIGMPVCPPLAKEDRQALQWLKEDRQALQWLKEDRQALQWLKEDGQA
jgi:hypothetical protein